MKVLYIGPYKDGTGWAHAAHENILALDAAGIDVVPRPLKLNDVSGEVSPRILELEEKSDKGCDIVIQNCLPHQMDYNGFFSKNIAYYFTETSHFKNSTWAERLNLMDEGWVPCQSVVDASLNSHVSIPLATVPVPAEMEKYQKEYKPLDIPHLKDKFVFYTIGEINKRKNLKALIMAFHLEFRPTEPVALVIKGSIPGKSADFSFEVMSRDANTIKDELKLYKDRSIFHPEVFMTQRMSENDIMRLHSMCDCYVSPSFGEGWNMPAFDAMAMGKTPICTNQGGPKDFIYNQYEQYEGHGNVGLVVQEGGWLVDCQPEPVFGMNQGVIRDIYVGNEEWQAINVAELRKTMRFVYENKEEREKRSNDGKDIAYNFSHANVGNMMSELLDGRRKATLHNESIKIREKHKLNGNR